jgi:Cupin-like domain
MTNRFNNWPDRTAFDNHVQKFWPFHVVRSTCVLYPNPEDLSALLCEVDICSIEINRQNVFYGDVLRRDHLRMKISAFADAFSAREQKKYHWMHDVGLNLYLSQATLYSSDLTKVPVQVVGLKKEIEILPPLLRSECVISQINLWMNVSVARTGLHYDQYNNILVVLRGRKIVSLVSPQYLVSTHAAYLVGSGEANHSLASSAAELVEANILHSDHVQTTVLHAGDALFIPEGWWHDVISDECSMALNFWFNSSLHPLFNSSSDSSVGSSSHMAPYLLRSSLQALIAEDMRRTLESYKRSSSSGHHKIYEMSHDQFEYFITDLCVQNISSDPFAKQEISTEHSEGKYRIVGKEALEEMIMSMEDSLVTCTHEVMARLWPTYAANNPATWGRVLLQLKPLSAYALTASWETFETQNGLILNVQEFFMQIFGPLGDQASLVGALRSIY